MIIIISVINTCIIYGSVKMQNNLLYSHENAVHTINQREYGNIFIKGIDSLYERGREIKNGKKMSNYFLTQEDRAFVMAARSLV